MGNNQTFGSPSSLQAQYLDHLPHIDDLDLATNGFSGQAHGWVFFDGFLAVKFGFVCQYDSSGAVMDAMCFFADSTLDITSKGGLSMKIQSKGRAMVLKPQSVEEHKW